MDVNYASLHPLELAAVIEAADLTTLAKIDADLKREGWSEAGVRRSRIKVRLLALTG